MDPITWEQPVAVQRIVKVLAVVGLWLSTIFGGWSPAMTLLLIAMGLDVVTGLARAFIMKELYSRIAWEGGVRKFLIIVIVFFASRIDMLMAMNCILRNGVVIYYLVQESLSLLENAGACGLPIPEALRDALTQLSQMHKTREGRAESLTRFLPR